jgi:hypothetical protein
VPCFWSTSTRARRQEASRWRGARIGSLDSRAGVGYTGTRGELNLGVRVTEITPDKRESVTWEGSPAWARLQDQVAWYDGKSQVNQRWFKGLKVCQIVVAAAIPVAAAASAPLWLIGSGGALIVVLEGLQQLQQYQQNWTTYRATCEQLKHEEFLFMARAGPYAVAANPEALLAERVESLVSQEHAAWVSHREEASTQMGGEG